MLKRMEILVQIKAPVSASPLARQHSTSSLPPSKLKQEAGGGGGGGGQGGWARTRLSCSFQRIRRPRHGHKEENSELNNNVAKLPEQYDTLKKVHADFEEFLSVVVEDLKEKVSRLQRFKASEAASAQERNYSALQLYMVEKYTARIQTFRGLASLHIQHICTIHSQTPASDISNLVTKYSKTVSKMKRRMKDMIDVTDKYAVVDIFDNINILNTATKDLDSLQDPATAEADRARRSIVSLMSVPQGDEASDIAEVGPEVSEVSAEEIVKAPFSGPDTSARTLRSLSDHLCVLRKTYLR